MFTVLYPTKQNKADLTTIGRRNAYTRTRGKGEPRAGRHGRGYGTGRGGRVCRLWTGMAGGTALAGDGHGVRHWQGKGLFCNMKEKEKMKGNPRQEYTPPQFPDTRSMNVVLCIFHLISLSDIIENKNLAAFFIQRIFSPFKAGYPVLGTNVSRSNYLLTGSKTAYKAPHYVG
jgi:hypothetical protein